MSLSQLWSPGGSVVCGKDFNLTLEDLVLKPVLLLPNCMILLPLLIHFLVCKMRIITHFSVCLGDGMDFREFLGSGELGRAWPASLLTERTVSRASPLQEASRPLFLFLAQPNHPCPEVLRNMINIDPVPARSWALR